MTILKLFRLAFFSIYFCLSSAFKLSAQEKIKLKSGDEITVNIIKIEEDFIKYKKLNDASGTIFWLPTENISKIVNKDGKNIDFPVNSNSTSKIKNSISPDSVASPKVWYLFGKQRVYFGLSTSFVKSTKNNFGLEMEIPLSKSFGLVSSLGFGQILYDSKTSPFYGGIYFRENPKYSGFSFGLRAHTAAALKDKHFDFMPGLFWAQTKVNDTDIKTNGFGGGIDMRIGLGKSIGLQGGFALPFKNFDIKNIGSGIGIYVILQ